MLTSSPLCAAQVPAEAAIFLNHGQQSEHQLSRIGAMVVRDTNTKQVVWTSTCRGAGEQGVAHCLAGHFKRSSRGTSEDLKARYDNWGTPLHIAACLGELDVVEYLVRRGATIDDPATHG